MYAELRGQNIRAIDYVLQNEGGYVDDSGGPTNYGITIPNLAAYRGVEPSTLNKEDILNLTLAEAILVYESEYWLKMHLDLVVDVNEATAIFDIGVNRGPYIAQLYAQKACCALYNYCDLDGIIGPQTAQEIARSGVFDFINSLSNLEWAGYQAILAKHPEDEPDRIGWENRAKRLLTLTK